LAWIIIKTTRKRRPDCSSAPADRAGHRPGCRLFFISGTPGTDFWPVFDSYPGLKGIIHSFSASVKELEEALARDLYIGLNGIMTFTKDQAQLEAARQVPLDRLVLETDAPFLAPAPFRGQRCEPKHVRVIAEFLARLRSENPLEN
jgi:Tat protein secretion system quality control protein TatD with DNase activity